VGKLQSGESGGGVVQILTGKGRDIMQLLSSEGVPMGQDVCISAKENCRMPSAERLGEIVPAWNALVAANGSQTVHLEGIVASSILQRGDRLH